MRHIVNNVYKVATQARKSTIKANFSQINRPPNREKFQLLATPCTHSSEEFKGHDKAIFALILVGDLQRLHPPFETGIIARVSFGDPLGRIQARCEVHRIESNDTSTLNHGIPRTRGVAILLSD